MGRIKDFQIDPDKLLDCVFIVLRERGLGGLTLDAVAAAAGISKGGLIHHFPSKRALLQAVVAREAAQLERDYRHNLAENPSGPGAKCRALLATFQSIFDPSAPSDWMKCDLSLYAASIEDPELVKPYSEMMMAIASELEDDGIDKTQVRVILAAVVGLYHEAAQPVTFSRTVGREIFASLRSLVDSFCAAPPARRSPVLVPRKS